MNLAGKTQFTPGGSRGILTTFVVAKWQNCSKARAASSIRDPFDGDGRNV